MAFAKKLAYESFMARYGIMPTDLPAYLQAQLRLFLTARQAAGDQLSPELAEEAADLESEIREWFEETDDELVAAPAPPPPPPAPASPPTSEQVLAQLYSQGARSVTAAQLKAAGFLANPGTTGTRCGSYQLTKPLFGNTYVLEKLR